MGEDTAGIVFDIQRFSVHDGPGIRTNVFLKGCPLRCRWCSNPESQRPDPEMTFEARRCIGCGECGRRCPAGAVLAEKKLTVDLSRCRACGDRPCLAGCHARALAVTGRAMTVGEVMAEVEKDRSFYHGGG
ncbi:MAG: 4Fe-4S cluster-binding domain-containing protein, partial [Planctomycetes bacterium]|nr:4Fe-4S cluster-binding domain-containing protein [Planctomycetota bacterium]